MNNERYSAWVGSTTCIYVTKTGFRRRLVTVPISIEQRCNPSLIAPVIAGAPETIAAALFPVCLERTHKLCRCFANSFGFREFAASQLARPFLNTNPITFAYYSRGTQLDSGRLFFCNVGTGNTVFSPWVLYDHAPRFGPHQRNVLAGEERERQL